MTRRVCILFALFAPACPPPAPDTPTSDAGTTEAAATAGSSTTDPSTDPTTSGPDATSGTADIPTGTGGSTGESLCGNGVIDFGEPCDDGNRLNADGCNRDCTLSGAIVWEFRSKIHVIDQFNDVTVAPDGSIFAGGHWNGEGRWLTRFDENGQGVWSRTFKTATFEQIHALTADGSAVYAAGAIATAGNRDAWLGRHDFEGNLVWERIHDSGLGDDYLTGISRTPEGELVVAGFAGLDGNLAELWTRRYAADGAVQWTQGLPIGTESLYSIGPGVIAAADQIVVGYAHVPQPDTFEELLVAYPPNGAAPLWMQSLPMTSGPILGLARDPGGDILAAVNGTMLRRLTSTGKPQWVASGCADSTGEDVAVDSQGDIVVVGVAFQNIRVCKFAADGALRWEREIDGGQGFDLAEGVALMPDDRIVVAGEVENGQVSDAWLAMFTP